jgi:Methyltransferase domain
MRQDGDNDLTAGGYPLTIRVMAKPQVNTTDEILGTDTVPRVSSGRPRLTLPRWGAELSGVPEVSAASSSSADACRWRTGASWTGVRGSAPTSGVPGVQPACLRDRHGREPAAEIAGTQACSGGEQLPFGDGTFDLLVFNEVIEHVRNDRQTIQDALRMLACDDPTRDQPNVTSGACLV